MNRLEVRSVDGVRIGAEVHGEGEETVLLVHGTCGARTDWALVTPGLAEHYRVATMDRRGRGLSGGAEEPHELRLEIADVAAVAAALDGPVHLIGHSFGGLCALGAAGEIPLRSLVLYEPPAAGVHVSDEDVAATLALIAAGDLDGAVAHFLARVADIPQFELTVIAALEESWASVVAGVRTAPREAAAVKACNFADARPIEVPTLLLLGERTTAPIYVEGADLIRRLLRRPHSATLIGQGHLAIGFDPGQFVDRVLDFLETIAADDEPTGRG